MASEMSERDKKREVELFSAYCEAKERYLIDNSPENRAEWVNAAVRFNTFEKLLRMRDEQI